MDHYSVPAGAYKDQVPNHIAQARLKKLLRAGENAYVTFASSNIGHELALLIEKSTSSPLSDSLNIATFSGWSQNYLACDETNFMLISGQKIARGQVVRGVYQGVSQRQGTIPNEI